MGISKISWCDYSLGFWMGCTKVSPGCANCYAERDMDKRFHRVKWGNGQPRVERIANAYQDALRWDRKAKEMGVRPRVFVNPNADWLDEEVPLEWLFMLLTAIRDCRNLDFLLLTKRPEAFAARLNAVWLLAHEKKEMQPLFFYFACWLSAWFLLGNAPENVWVGVTVENQDIAPVRISKLLGIPANKRFLSCEPLLGPLDLCHVQSPTKDWLVCDVLGNRWPPFIDWVICGGESGPNARPMHPDWARSLRDQCKATGVPFFFKQWGEWAPYDQYRDFWNASEIGFSAHNIKKIDGITFHKIGTKAAGDLLDGVRHREFPKK